MSQKVIFGLSLFLYVHGLPYVLLLKDVMTSGVMDGGNSFRSMGCGYYLQKVMQKTMNMDLQYNFWKHLKSITKNIKLCQKLKKELER